MAWFAFDVQLTEDVCGSSQGRGGRQFDPDACSV
jgi:hypothetical protein